MCYVCKCPHVERSIEKEEKKVMAEVVQTYTLVLTIKVQVQEDENEIDHDRLRGELQAMFPTSEKVNDGKIMCQVTHRQLTRDANVGEHRW